MDPITAISLATGVLKATGLGAKIGDWIGGDRGEKAASKILDVAQKVSGSETPEDAIEQLKQNDALAVGMRQELMRHEATILRLHVEDLSDAREMQKVAIMSDDPWAQRFVYLYAGFWSFFGAAYISAITFLPVPEDSQRFADTALGFMLGTIIAQIINFFFGSSKGSSDKTRILKEQLKGYFK